MNIDLDKWKEFTKEQEDAQQKVADRIELWHKENPYEPPKSARGYLDYDWCYKARELWEEYALEQKFGVVEITFENFLSWLSKK